MTLSPSEIFQTALAGRSVVIQPYLRVIKHLETGSVIVSLRIDQNKPTQYYKSLVVRNPLAMMQAINTLKAEAAKHLNGREVSEKVTARRTQAEIAKDYLREVRSMVHKINEKKRLEQEQEQLRSENIISNVRKPILAILERVTPVIDPWAYRNVYGKPAEVFIF